MIRVRSSAGLLAEEVREFIRETGEDDGEIVKRVTRLVLRDCVRITPPAGSINSLTESFPAQRRIGKAAVTRDLHRAFRLIDDLKVLSAPTNPRTAQKVLNAKVKADPVLLAVVLNNLRYPGITSDRILDAPDEETHNSLRVRGRVGNRVQPYWVMNKPGFDDFLGIKLSLVGKLKSGWVPACDALNIPLPTWIRFQRDATGSYVDGTMGEGAKRFFRCVNGTSYADDVTGMPPDRIVEIAMHNQAGSLFRQLMAKREGRWNKHNGNRWSTAR
jgi:hypothetical protein